MNKFKKLPIEIVWIIQDFLKPSPRMVYDKCSKELIQTSQTIKKYSSIQTDYYDYVVQCITSEKTLECRFVYAQINSRNYYSFKTNYILMSLSQGILLNLNKKQFKLPNNMLGKPYNLPFNTNNYKTHYVEIFVVMFYTTLLLFMYFNDN